MAASVRREVVLPVRPDELWPALTEAERLEEWFAPDVSIDPRPGGASTSSMTARRLAFRWAESGDGESGDHGHVDQSRVEFTLDEVAEGTRLRVVETGSADTLPAVVAMLGSAGAWPQMLARLARVRAAVAA
jgi:uncharacterized protein YndB with AHSA1/START domain